MYADSARLGAPLALAALALVAFPSDLPAALRC
jgi:hypothetical protein